MTYFDGARAIVPDWTEHSHGIALLLSDVHAEAHVGMTMDASGGYSYNDISKLRGSWMSETLEGPGQGNESWAFLAMPLPPPQ